jgi:hypothetical protein
VVKSWPYDANPSDISSYWEFELKQHYAVQAAVLKALTNAKGTAKMNENNIVVNLEGIKVKELRTYQVAVIRGIFILQDQFFARVVKSWPYDFNPSDPISYGELELQQFYTVHAAIEKAIRQLTNKLNQSQRYAYTTQAEENNL